MAVTKTKMDVSYLKTKVEEAKKKYIKQHAVDTAAYTKAKAQHDKELVKYHNDLLTKLTAAIKAGEVYVDGHYSFAVTFNVKNNTQLFLNIKKPQLTMRDPGELNTRNFDAKLAILGGCTEAFIAISVDDYDWMNVLL